MATDGRLTDKAEYGQHIALTCIHHPNLRWSTKNIAPIGCRTIFFDLHNESKAHECSCSWRDLVVAPESADPSDKTD